MGRVVSDPVGNEQQGRHGPPRWSPEGQRRIQRARERILSSRHDEPVGTDGLVRPEIAASWRRSLLSGVDPSRIPWRDVDPDRTAPRLLRAAEPVLARLVEYLAGTSTAVVLADSKAWILWRGAGRPALFSQLDRISASPGCCLSEELVGTNGLGTVIEERRPNLIVGGEHYQDSMQDFTCVGVPIVDPLSNRLEGVLDLTCASRDTNELLLPLLTEVVREIQARLSEQATARERALFEEFMARTRRRRNVAVASLNEDFLITNSAAAQLFEPADHALLWDWAGDAVASGREVVGPLTLAREITVDARCVPVDSGGAGPAGVVVTLMPSAHPPASSRSAVTAGSEWKRLLRHAERLAALGNPVLLHGEPGVGKVWLAKWLHRRRETGGPCLVLDCRTHARGGDAWLDRLDRALADPRYTVVLRRADALPEAGTGTVTALVGGAAARVVLTATQPSAEPGGLLDAAGAVLGVPPLRERADDIARLVDDLLAELVAEGESTPRCTAAALSALKDHPWPGNVRELRRVLAGALVQGGAFHIDVRHLPEAYRRRPRHRRLGLLESSERDSIVAALERAGGNRDRAAADLGISRATIYRKIRRFGIS